MILVIEIQANGDNVAAITNQCPTSDVANQTYHTILAAAAVSSVETHSAVMLSDDGRYLKSESYSHPLPPTADETGCADCMIAWED